VNLVRTFLRTFVHAQPAGGGFNYLTRLIVQNVIEAPTF
jgi:hypothetical protein